jgi:hypothetical protein
MSDEIVKPQRVFGHINAKTSKGEPLGWLTLVRYLAPSDVSGFNVCANAGACAGFRADGTQGLSPCLYTSGRGYMQQTKDARIKKTIDAVSNRADHLERAAVEIMYAQARARMHHLRLAVRVNGTSDLPADTRHLARQFPAVQFYDYTKIQGALKHAPKNLHYTFSHDALSAPEAVCREVLATGTNVAVVFDLASFGGALPRTWFGARVVNGDLHDLRFLDPRGVVVGLSAKGDAKKTGAEFAVRA